MFQEAPIREWKVCCTLWIKIVGIQKLYKAIVCKYCKCWETPVTKPDDHFCNEDLNKLMDLSVDSLGLEGVQINLLF